MVQVHKFLKKLNTFYPRIKLTADYSKETMDFLDVNIGLVGGDFWQICLLNLPIHAGFLIQVPLTLIIAIQSSSKAIWNLL